MVLQSHEEVEQWLWHSVREPMVADDTVDFALTIVDFLADHPGTAYSVADIADQFKCGTWRAQLLLRALAQVHLLECTQSALDDAVTYRARWSHAGIQPGLSMYPG